jgi:crotonobetaine/carnitine-CoA ligase
MAPVVRSPSTTFGAGRSASWLLDVRAATQPDAPFLVWEPFVGEPRTWTYGGFAAQVARVAAGLRRRGVAEGDRVLVHLENSPEYLLTWFAVARLGAVAVCTNTRSSLDELSYYVSHSGARHAVTQPSLRSLAEQAMPAAQNLLVTPTDAGAPPDRPDLPESDVAFSALLLDEAGEASPYTGASSAAVSIQYTSGTTGRPKAVVWTHANTFWGAAVNAAHEGLTRDDVHLTYLPLFHTNAQGYSVLATLYAGGSIVLQPRFSASRFWEVSVRNRATWCSQIYFALRALQAHETPAQHSYRLWGTGMAGHPSEAHTGVPTMGWWGMTETVSHPIVTDPRLPGRPGTMGRAAPEYEVAVVGPDGSAVEPGDTGELLVRGVPGLSLFAGYLHDEEATAAAFDEHGWFRTGDLVTVEEEGFLRFADRAKDMLKIGAENVAASEIERAVLTVAEVAEVAVVPAPHPMLDQVPVAFVVPRGTASEDLPEQVIGACRRRLADFKVPHSVRIVDALPRATLEKVAKHELRRLLAREHQA